MIYEYETAPAPDLVKYIFYIDSIDSIVVKWGQTQTPTFMDLWMIK